MNDIKYNCYAANIDRRAFDLSSRATIGGFQRFWIMKWFNASTDYLILGVCHLVFLLGGNFFPPIPAAAHWKLTGSSLARRKAHFQPVAVHWPELCWQNRSLKELTSSTAAQVSKVSHQFFPLFCKDWEIWKYDKWSIWKQNFQPFPVDLIRLDTNIM